MLFSLKQDKNSKHNEDYAGKFDNLMTSGVAANSVIEDGVTATMTGDPSKVGTMPTFMGIDCVLNSDESRSIKRDEDLENLKVYQK